MKIRKNMFIIALAAIVFSLISSWNVFAQSKSDDIISAKDKEKRWKPMKEDDKGDKATEIVDYLKLYNKSGLPVTVVATNEEEKEFKLEAGAEGYRDEMVPGGLRAGSFVTIKIGAYQRTFGFSELINALKYKNWKANIEVGEKKVRNLEIAYQPDQKAIVIVVSPEGKFEHYK